MAGKIVLAEDARLELERSVAAFRELLRAQSISKGKITKRSVKKAYIGYEKAIRAQRAAPKPTSWIFAASIILTAAGGAGGILSPVHKPPAELPEDTYLVASVASIALGAALQVYSSRKGGGG